MKLVIDIPEIMYEEIKEYGIRNFYALTDSIRNATPLTDCTDAISREAVIELLESRYSFDTVMSIYEEVLDLPSVNPTTDKAKWIKVDEHLYECSCCGYNYRNYDGQLMKFCMNCGSVMEGGE